MKNNERNSRKRLNSLILLVAFTAVMLIVSTYAWFSTQKNVTLTGLKGVVHVAEGLQISLDGERWVNSINFDHFNQTSADSWTVKDDSPTQYLASGNTFQKPRGADGGITNVVPEELLPVSTTGYDSTGDGIGEANVKFYRGENQETVKLMDDTNVLTGDKEAGYFAFDLYLMNTSAGDANDQLLLDPISDVRGENEAAGVQNTARVALALYGNTAADAKVEGGETAAEILAATSTGKTISDIAIWEPNANEHTDTIVNSAANSLKLTDADQGNSDYTNLTHVKIGGTTYHHSTFTTNSVLPTYALTSASKPASPKSVDSTDKVVHIADVYDWRTPATGVKKQFTLQTDSYSGSASVSQREDAVPFISTKAWETATTTDPATTPTDDSFSIGANQYHKVRVYFWMEGQDPDCINAASLGKGLTLDLGFSKPGQEGSGSNS